MATRPTRAAEIRIRPSGRWRDLGLSELPGNGELLYYLVLRDVKVRYRQTVFGVLWAFLQPILMTAVLTLFLGRLKGIGPEGVPYPLFVLSGLVAWNLFAQTFAAVASSLVSSAGLLQKVYFPRLLFPISSVGVYVIDHVVGLGTVVALMLFYGAAFHPAILLTPLFAVLIVVVSLSFGLWAAALNVRYRDVRYVVPFLVQLWFLATPVAYTAALVPSEFRSLVSLNPMIALIQGFRWAILGEAAPTAEALAQALVVSILIGFTGLIYFRRVERTFADVI
jgi:lipopolysaccharide transport system permease protein